MRRLPSCAPALALLFVAAVARADETTRISNAVGGAAGAGSSNASTISADGNVVAFQSAAADLVAGDSNHKYDVFAFDRSTGLLERVSVRTNGAQGNGDSFGPTVSSDGRYVAFESSASNLDADPNGTVGDVFLRDRLLGTTTLVSRDLAGTGADGESFSCSISADGERIAFTSRASNLVPNDTNGCDDVFLFDRASGTTTLVSSASDGTQGNGPSDRPWISGDGNVVAFASQATNFPEPPFSLYYAVYAKDLATGALERIDVDSSGSGAVSVWEFATSISDDGSLVTFVTFAPLAADDTNDIYDVYLRDRGTATTERISLGSGSRELDRGAPAGAISGDGRFLVFTSEARNAVAGDGNDASDVFVRDRLRDVTMRVSVGTHDEESAWGSGVWGGRQISADGATIVFESYGPEFVANDSNVASDVFLRERSMIPAAWTNYGAGFPGRDGAVPTMTPEHAPYRGGPVWIDVSCSSRLYASSFVFVGLTRDSIPTSLGGTLLLDSIVLFPLPLTPYGGSFLVDVPTDWRANGLVVELQTLELDPFAAKGVSFTDGLELTLGDG